uniref:Uncharacterized protein n=1 Tax=Chenopodium quinoa TaxID=63459 RepID=A0A803MHR4_CHEQI
MGLIDLFVVASLPVVKVLLITALGLFLALDRVDILGENARHHLNKLGAVYLWLYVYNVVRVTACEVAGETDTNYEALLPSTTDISSSSVKFLHCYLNAVGMFLALERIDLLGENARNHLNKIVFYVFSPSLIAANLAKTVTFQSFLSLWFMPINILVAFIIGAILGWLLVKITRPPKHLKGLIIGTCSAGNMGIFPIILIPAICKEKGSPFGAIDVCETYALSYSSLSLAIGAVYIWSLVYNIVRMSAEEIARDKEAINSSGIPIQEPLLPCSENHCLAASHHQVIINSS